MCSCLASPSTVRQPIGEFGPVCRLAKAKAWPLAKNGESMAISKKWVGDDDGEEVAIANYGQEGAMPKWPQRACGPTWAGRCEGTFLFWRFIVGGVLILYLYIFNKRETIHAY